MTRQAIILHVVYARSEHESWVPQFLEAVRIRRDDACGEIRHEALAVGDRAAALLTACGLSGFRRVSAPLGQPVLARRAARLAAPKADIVMAWGLAAATAAADIRSDSRRLVWVDEMPRARGMAFEMSSILNATVLCDSTWLARRWSDEHPSLDVRACPDHCVQIQARGSRAALRQELLGGASARHDDLLIGLVRTPGPARKDAAFRFSYLLGLVGVAGGRRPLTGIMARCRGGAGHGEINGRRAARAIGAHGHRWGLVTSAMPLHEMLMACDLAVADVALERAVPALSAVMRIAAAAGCPIVVPPTGEAHATLLPEFAELVAPNASLIGLGAPVVELATNAERLAELRGRMHISRQTDNVPAFSSRIPEFWRESLKLPLDTSWVRDLVRGAA